MLINSGSRTSCKGATKTTYKVTNAHGDVMESLAPHKTRLPGGTRMRRISSSGSN